MPVYAIDKLISETRRLAVEFRRSTGQPLPVSGEIARYDAARFLNLTLCEPRNNGVDAVGNGDQDGLRFQIKVRVLSDDNRPGVRIGQINPNGEWDKLLLVIMDHEYEACEIYEVDKELALEVITIGGDSHRVRRGAMSVAKFKNIGLLTWTRETGVAGDAWTNY